MPVETIALIAPDAPVEAIFRAADWPTSSKNVIVVGHEPTLGMVAGQLLNGIESYVPFKKGAVWWFRFCQQDGETKAVLVAMASPDTGAQ